MAGVVARPGGPAGPGIAVGRPRERAPTRRRRLRPAPAVAARGRSRRPARGRAVPGPRVADAVERARPREGPGERHPAAGSCRGRVGGGSGDGRHASAPARHRGGHAFRRADAPGRRERLQRRAGRGRRIRDRRPRRCRRCGPPVGGPGRRAVVRLPDPVGTQRAAGNDGRAAGVAGVLAGHRGRRTPRPGGHAAAPAGGRPPPVREPGAAAVGHGGRGRARPDPARRATADLAPRDGEHTGRGDGRRADRGRPAAAGPRRCGPTGVRPGQPRGRARRRRRLGHRHRRVPGGAGVVPGGRGAVRAVGARVVGRGRDLPAAGGHRSSDHARPAGDRGGRDPGGRLAARPAAAGTRTAACGGGHTRWRTGGGRPAGRPPPRRVHTDGHRRRSG